MSSWGIKAVIGRIPAVRFLGRNCKSSNLFLSDITRFSGTGGNILFCTQYFWSFSLNQNQQGFTSLYKSTVMSLLLMLTDTSNIFIINICNIQVSPIISILSSTFWMRGEGQKLGNFYVVLKTRSSHFSNDFFLQENICCSWIFFFGKLCD